MDSHVIVTGVRNPSHLVYVASYLRSLLANWPGTVTVTHIGGGRGLGRIAVTAQHVRSLLPDDPRLRIVDAAGEARWRFPDDRWAIYVAVGAPGLKPYARMVAANRGRRPLTVVTDEGLGSYGDRRARNEAWARQGVRQPWRAVRVAAVEGGLRTLPNRRWALYEEHDGDWSVASAVAAEFRRYDVDVRTRPGVAVLLTQPWTLLGAVDRTSYREHVAAVQRDVAAAGLDLVVRPHPAEDPDDYRGFAVESGDAPAELDPDVIGAELVLGGPSTALLNLAAVHGRPARLVVPPGLGRTALLSPRQQRLMDRFVPDVAHGLE